MLTRQWQLGEFQGDDAGSPAFAKVHVSADPLASYRPGDHAARALDRSVPLERRWNGTRSVPAVSAGGEPEHPRADGARMVEAARRCRTPHADRAVPPRFPVLFPVRRPRDDDHGAPLDVAEIQRARGRAMDGFDVSGWKRSARRAISVCSRRPSSWTRKRSSNSTGSASVLGVVPATVPPAGRGGSRVEERAHGYKFACSCGSGETARSFAAEEYFRSSRLVQPRPGRARRRSPDSSATRTDLVETFLPAPVGFSGMPNTRWWAFEDHRVNFGGITPDSTDLVKLLVMEFGLVYANDWFSFPVRLEVGQWCQVRGPARDERLRREALDRTRRSRSRHRSRLDDVHACRARGDSTSPVTGLLLVPRSRRCRKADRSRRWSATRWRTWSGPWKRSCPWRTGAGVLEGGCERAARGTASTCSRGRERRGTAATTKRTSATG